MHLPTRFLNDACPAQAGVVQPAAGCRGAARIAGNFRGPSPLEVGQCPHRDSGPHAGADAARRARPARGGGAGGRRGQRRREPPFLLHISSSCAPHSCPRHLLLTITTVQADATERELNRTLAAIGRERAGTIGGGGGGGGGGSGEVSGGPLGLTIFGGGAGGIEELALNLRDDRTQFGLLKFELGGQVSGAAVVAVAGA